MTQDSLPASSKEQSTASARSSQHLPDGMYNVVFRVQGRQASGVVVIHGYKFAGGDSGMAYYGNFTETGSILHAHVTTLRHTETGGIALLGADNLDFSAEGQPTPNGAYFTGTARPIGHRFEITLAKLATPGFSV
ncbi:hypothetical protein [Devosia submarina]|uniref:hypothetical protein n=1 Tax=Devosia submarina TaxID=1173082 RepID=UPI00130087A6|nr:hypothetical protein [Devosia submarina]